MKKVSMALLAAGLVLALTACGGKSVNVDETTLILDAKGSLTQAVVEEFDESKFKSSELETYVEDSVKEYAAKHGDDSVTLESVKVKDNVAKMVLTFANADTYAGFEGCDFFVGTVSEAMIAGYSFDDYFSSVTDGALDGATLESGDATHNVLGKVVIVGENTRVQVPGKIVYLSSTGTELISSDTVAVDLSKAYGKVVYIIYE